MLKKLHLCHIHRCIICQSHNHKIWTTTSYKQYLQMRPDLINKEDPIVRQHWLLTYPFILKQCSDCGFIFTSPQLTSASLAAIYNQNAGYVAHYRDNNTPAMQALKASYKVEIARLEKFKQKGKLLDVGCNNGLLLSLLKNQWQCTGIDIDKNAIAQAKKCLGKRVKLINSSLHESHLPKANFDVIIMRGLIEHISNPRLLLKNANQLLKSGGVLFLNAPNIASICGRLYKKNFRMVDPIHHIWYFSPQTIKRLLTDYGFRIASINYNYFNTPYFHVQDILQIGKDWLVNKITHTLPERASPPFYGNLMDIYAYKTC